jgi:NADH dehydrogenase (ubiquinone) Fe-S protein 3
MQARFASQKRDPLISFKMRHFKQKLYLQLDSVDFLLEKLAPGKIFFLKEQNKDLYFFVFPECLFSAANFIKNSSLFQCKQLMDIVVVDLFNSQYSSFSQKNYSSKKARFEVNYHFLSVTYQRRVFFKTVVEASEGTYSLVSLFDSANWLEREIWDLFGVVSFGHPDLRRILTDYGFQGHPLCKDFPLSGFVEAEYSISKKRVFFKNTSLVHEYRNFSFSNPWKAGQIFAIYNIKVYDNVSKFVICV